MHPVENDLVIRPALQSYGPPLWNGAVWIGEVWVDAIDDSYWNAGPTGLPVRCRLLESQGYTRARLLVRTESRPLGFVEVAISDGDFDFDTLRRRVAELQRMCSPQAPTPAGSAGVGCTDRDRVKSVTVILCTRDRVALLRTALASILAVDYPDFETIVVDNAAKTSATREYVLSLGAPRVRIVDEPRPGLSRARNAGLLAATGDIVAFTDDDVVVDRYWLRALVDGFAMGTSTSCVSGLVPAGELRTPAQAYFDRRVGWANSSEPRVFDWTHPPRDVPLFPFAVRHYGTGANFAMERDIALRLGGFDEALGAGSPTGGGEDIDMFFRILRAGRQLVHNPAAIVWHRHRADDEGILEQTRGYGMGLGAWLRKIAGDREAAMLALKVATCHGPAFVRHIRGATQESAAPTDLEGLLPPNIGSVTWRSITKGLWAYGSARREGRASAPLLERSDVIGTRLLSTRLASGEPH
jgi:GT2 family glycosyltransferase